MINNFIINVPSSNIYTRIKPFSGQKSPNRNKCINGGIYAVILEGNI